MNEPTTTLFDFRKAEDEWAVGAPAPADLLLGREAVYTTDEGERLVGVVEAPLTGPAGTGRYPIVRFPSGKWARLGDVVEVVERRTQVTVSATVDRADLQAFLATDPDLLACVRARMTEVFGDDGAVLSTVDVTEVDTHDEDAVTVTVSRKVAEYLRDLVVDIDVDGDDETWRPVAVRDAAADALRAVLA